MSSLNLGFGFTANALICKLRYPLSMNDTKSQLEKFKEAARDLETDDDEARFDERLRKIVKPKPAPEKPE